MVRGRGASHCRGNRTQIATARGGKSGNLLRARALSCPSTTSKILGAARGDEYGASLAISRQVAACPRTARTGLHLVHRRLRHARSERGKRVACRVGLKEPIEAERLRERSGFGRA